MSLTETLVEDRARVPRRRRCARARSRRSTARRSRAADLVLADTAAHADYLVELGAGRARVAVWHLGAEPEFLGRRRRRRVEPRRVLFYGRYLPLHGVDTIVAAAGAARRRRASSC